MSAEEIATAFVQHFYQAFDNGVDALGGLFVSYHFVSFRLIIVVRACASRGRYSRQLPSHIILSKSLVASLAVDTASLIIDAFGHRRKKYFENSLAVSMVEGQDLILVNNFYVCFSGADVWSSLGWG
jgi:hypothetical protein